MCVSDLQVKELIHQEIKPLDEDIRSAKNWAIGLLSTILLGMFGMGVWVGAVENRVTNVEEEHERFEDRIEQKLVRIENLLLELNKGIKN